MQDLIFAIHKFELFPFSIYSIHTAVQLSLILNLWEIIRMKKKMAIGPSQANSLIPLPLWKSERSPGQGHILRQDVSTAL